MKKLEKRFDHYENMSYIVPSSDALARRSVFSAGSTARRFNVSKACINEEIFVLPLNPAIPKSTSTQRQNTFVQTNVKHTSLSDEVIQGCLPLCIIICLKESLRCERVVAHRKRQVRQQSGSNKTIISEELQS